MNGSCIVPNTIISPDSRAYGGGAGCEYLLHMVMKHGVSLDLVKFLVEADKEKKTFKLHVSIERAMNTLVLVLISNRTNHKPSTNHKHFRQRCDGASKMRGPGIGSILIRSLLSQLFGTSSSLLLLLLLLCIVVV